MIRTLLTALFLTLFCSLAWAKSVYRCNGIHVIQSKGGKLAKYPPENFEFSVDQKAVTFGDKWFFADVELTIFNWATKDLWQASDNVVTVSFNQGQFISTLNVVEEKGVTAILVAADCDQF